MDTYKIDVAYQGLFRVIVTDSNGHTTIRDRFVSELAAQKWVKKRQMLDAHSQDGRPFSLVRSA